MNDYAACASTPATGEAAVSGTLNPRHASLYFEGEELRVDFPLQDLDISLDPEDEGRVIFTHPKFPGIECYTYSAEILRHPNLARRAGLRNRIEELTREREGPSRHAVLVFSVFGGIAALLLFLALGNNLILGWIVQGLPASWEEQIGDRVMAEVWEEFDRVHDPAYTNFLQGAAERLLASLPKDRRYSLYVAESEEENAFAIPGGHIVVLSGLIENVESSEELAGVLAHEIAHLRRRHGMRGVAAAAGPVLITKYFMGSRNGFLTALAATSAYIGQQRYSRENELEADDLGFDYLVKARIHPRGMVRFFERLEQAEGGFGGPDFLSSHPPTSERLAHLKARLAGVSRGRTFRPLPKIPQPKPRGSADEFTF